jgi:hypothetical protein
MDKGFLVTDEMVEEFKKLDTCCLSDAMDRLASPAGLWESKA